MKDEEIRKAVRESYGKIALQETANCSQATSCGCGCGSMQDTVSKAIGYSDEELSAVPEGANLGLGCGNPTALASLKEGEVVLDPVRELDLIVSWPLIKLVKAEELSVWT